MSMPPSKPSSPNASASAAPSSALGDVRLGQLGFVTTIMVAVFPVYYASTAAKGLAPSDITYKFSLATTIALTITALTAPVLGAVADYAAMKKRLLLIFQVIGVVATAAMVFIYTGDWMLALVLFVVANIGVAARSRSTIRCCRTSPP